MEIEPLQVVVLLVALSVIAVLTYIYARATLGFHFSTYKKQIYKEVKYLILGCILGVILFFIGSALRIYEYEEREYSKYDGNKITARHQLENTSLEWMTFFFPLALIYSARIGRKIYKEMKSE